MKRASKYALKNGRIYKIYNKRLGQILIFKILSDNMKEIEEGKVTINDIELYLRSDHNLPYKYHKKPSDLIVFKDDNIYELSETELFLEIL